MYNAKDYSTVLAKAIKRGLLTPEMITQEWSAFIDSAKTLHKEDRCYFVERYSAPRSNITSPSSRYKEVSVSFLTLKDYTLCRCVEATYFSAPGDIEVAARLADADHAALLAKKLTPVKLSSGALSKRVNALEQHIKVLENFTMKGTIPAHLDDLHFETSKKLQEAAKHLESLSKDPRAKEKKTAEIRASLTSARSNRFNVTLDETPVLVSLVLHGPTHAIRELLEIFTIRHWGVFYAAVMPRFVYDYLQRELYRSNSAPSSLNALSAHENDELNAFAASLWVPEDPSAPYSDLNEALKAAVMMGV